MIKQILLSLFLLWLLWGCGKERIVDISTDAQMRQKDIIYIFPSIPKEYCYADTMTELLIEYNKQFDLSDTQMLSTPQAVDCTYYGFGGCRYLRDEEESEAYAITCTSVDSSKTCFTLLGTEYKDVEGNMVEESCIMGANYN